jgi:hypothetical protein
MTGDNTSRRADDIGGQELSYAEVKAIASGNPAVLTLAEADAEIQRLTLLRKNHLDEQFVARRKVRDLPGIIAHMAERLARLQADQGTATAHASDRITIGNRPCSHDVAFDRLGAVLEGLPRVVHEPRRAPLGIYCGLRFGLLLNQRFAPDLYVEGETTRQTGFFREHPGPRAILNALERTVQSYGSECDRVRQELALTEGQLRDFQARLGQPFLHDAYLSELTSLRDQLKASLSGTAPGEGADTALGASDLAEAIKALKSAQTVEALPQRAEKRSCSVEESVTSRIRRRRDETTGT